MAADWGNAKIKWIKVSQKGYSICKRMADTLIQRYTSNTSRLSLSAKQHTSIIVKALSGLIPCSRFEEGGPPSSSLMDPSDDLRLVVGNLETISENMKKWSDSLISLKKLLEGQNQENEIIFQVCCFLAIFHTLQQNSFISLLCTYNFVDMEY